MEEAPRQDLDKLEDFDDNSLQPKGELGRYEFRYAEIQEFPFENKILHPRSGKLGSLLPSSSIYSQGENGKGFKRGVVIGWKKGEPSSKGGGMTRKIQPLAEQKQKGVKEALKDIIKGSIGFW